MLRQVHIGRVVSRVAARHVERRQGGGPRMERAGEHRVPGVQRDVDTRVVRCGWTRYRRLD